MSKPIGTYSLFGDMVSSLKSPEFWSFSAWLDLVSKYRRSKLGIFWLFTPPVMTFGLLGYFYSGITKKDPVHFIPFMGIGYLLWRMVTQVFNDASATMLAHRAFIMDGRTRLTDYVLRCMSRAFLYFSVGLVVISVAFVISPDVSIARALTLFVTMPIFLFNLFCLGIVLALLGARFPDLHELTTTIFIFGFLLTPILWYPEHVAAGSIRWKFMQANPAYHFIELVRAPVLGREVTRFTLLYVASVTVGGAFSAAILYRRYARFVPIWI
jgi:ABC-type polysaccharide/polyol phosphate export permease